jgi:acyl carrier protein
MTIRLTLFLAAASLAASAEAPKIISVSVPNGDRQSLYITFDPAPPEAQVKPRLRWVIYQTSPAGSRRLGILSVDISTLTTAKTIQLEVDPPVPLDVKALDVSWYGEEGAVHVPKESVSLGVDQPEGPVSGAKNKDDADIYIKGSYTAVVDGDPVYDIDAFAGFMYGIQNRSKTTFFGWLGAYGQVRTKNASKADPNSFLTYLVYQRYVGRGTRWLGPFSLPYFNYRFAGWEFDHDGKQLNFINSPVMTFPMRLSGKLGGELEPGLTFPNMTFQLGTEFVDVRTISMTNETSQLSAVLEQIVRRFAPRDRAAVPLTADTRLIEDVGIDSPRMIDVVLEVEDRFGIVIEDEAAQSIRTFGEMLSLVSGRAGAEA